MADSNYGQLPIKANDTPSWRSRKLLKYLYESCNCVHDCGERGRRPDDAQHGIHQMQEVVLVGRFRSGA